jgi:hypothetical protein
VELIEKNTGLKVKPGKDAKLEASQKDQSYLPDLKEQLEFRLSFFELAQ